MKHSPLLAALIMLAGCTSTPVPKTYVLSPPADPVTSLSNEAGRPVVEVPTVTMPDYLDTPDIFLRDGHNELNSSLTGRWGERLSLGVTHALVAALTRRLPGSLVTHSHLSGVSARSVLVDVDAFDIEPDGRCVLIARWSVTGPDAQASATAERGTFVTMVAGAGAARGAMTSAAAAPSDPAVVAAMAAAVDQLADRIALSLRRGSR